MEHSCVQQTSQVIGCEGHDRSHALLPQRTHEPLAEPLRWRALWRRVYDSQPQVAEALVEPLGENAVVVMEQKVVTMVSRHGSPQEVSPWALSQITENRKVWTRTLLIFQYTIFGFCLEKAILRQSPRGIRNQRALRHLHHPSPRLNTPLKLRPRGWSRQASRSSSFTSMPLSAIRASTPSAATAWSFTLHRI